MILLTIGTQLPFDRLVEAVDEIALKIDEEIFGQIGSGAYEPRNFGFCRSMKPSEFDAKLATARVVVSHAGIGSILTAKKHHKPIVLFPRRAAFGEHRNDHQLATCAQLKEREGIYVAFDKDNLSAQLSRSDMTAANDLDNAGTSTRSTLIKGISDFLGSIK